LTPRAALRSTGAWWFLPVLLAIGTVFPALNGVAVTGYAAGDLSAAGTGLSYGGPLLAGMSAYAWSGWTQFHRPLRSLRSGPATLAIRGWPLLIGGPLVGCMAVAATARAVPSDLQSWTVMSLFLLTLLACGMLGAAMAGALPVVLAVPLAAGLTFVWINYLVATPSPRLHQLAPPILGFATSSQPALSAVLAVAVLSSTVVVGTLVLLSVTPWDRSPRVVNAALLATVVVAAVGLAWWSSSWPAQRHNLLAAEPRTTSLHCETHDQVEVCLWPESADMADDVAAVAGRMNAQVEGWGLPPIAEVSARSAAPGVASVDATPGIGLASMTLSLAEGYLKERVGCEIAVNEETFLREVVLAAAVSDAGVLEAQVDLDTLAAADQRLALPSSELGDWFASGLTEIRCRPAA
jgi:hypothetical protein